MSYQQHGLSREEDNVLGSYGEDDLDIAYEDLKGFAAVSESMLSVMREKGLMYVEGDEDKHYLTEEGKRLWKVRADEELKGKPVRPVAKTSRPLDLSTNLLVSERTAIAKVLRRYIRDASLNEYDTDTKDYLDDLVSVFQREGFRKLIDADDQNNFDDLFKRAFN